MLKFSSFFLAAGSALALTDGDLTGMVGEQRGFMIQVDLELYEWDFHVYNTSYAEINSASKGFSATTIASPTDGEIDYTFTDQGVTMGCIWQDDVTGEVTTARIQACEGPGHGTPTSFTKCMAGGGPVVNTLFGCSADSENCDFAPFMPSGGERQGKFAGVKSTSAWEYSDVETTWRGFAVQTSAIADEWDMTFNSDETVAWTSLSTGDVWGADVDLDSDSGTITLTVTSSTADSSEVGQAYTGLYSNQAGTLTNYMYIALGELGGDAPASFEDGLAEGNLQFALVGCPAGSTSTTCTFDAAKVTV